MTTAYGGAARPKMARTSMSASTTRAIWSQAVRRVAPPPVIQRKATQVVDKPSAHPSPRKDDVQWPRFLGSIRDHDTGARVVAELERSGIPHSDISIIANNDSGWFDRNRSSRIDRDADAVDDRAEGAAAGAGIGATLGGLTGLLAGLGIMAIPGIGP